MIMIVIMKVKMFKINQEQGNSNPPDNGVKKRHNFDVPTAIRVLHRRHFTDEASFLARKHDKHDDYIRIQLENINRQRARAALVYISGLSFLDAEAALKVNGKLLLQYLPEETTEILKSICTPSAHNSMTQTFADTIVKEETSRQQCQFRTFLLRQTVLLLPVSNDLKPMLCWSVILKNLLLLL